MDFNDLNELKEDELLSDSLYTPFANIDDNGNWVEGFFVISYLNSRYGKYDNVNDMIENSITEGHRLWFEWLKEKGLLN